MSEIKVVPGSLYVSESHTIEFNVDLGLGLVGTCRVYSMSNKVTGIPGRQWIEVQDADWDFSVAGKDARYSGVQELYEKIFGEKSFRRMLEKHEKFCMDEVRKGKVINVLTPDSLSADELEHIMENYIINRPQAAVSYDDVLYTTDYTLKSLAKIYNKKQPFDHLKINIFKTKMLPQTYQVNSTNPEVMQRWRDTQNRSEIEVVSLQKIRRESEGRCAVTPLRK